MAGVSNLSHGCRTVQMLRDALASSFLQQARGDWVDSEIWAASLWLKRRSKKTRTQMKMESELFPDPQENGFWCVIPLEANELGERSAVLIYGSMCSLRGEDSWTWRS